MKKVAITGNFCTGKSFVLDVFKAHGIPTFSFDKGIHWCYENDKHVVSEVGKLFPHAIDGLRVNRKALREMVFGDKKMLLELERILYPRVFKMEEEFFKKHVSDSIVALEVPLLFEKDLVRNYNYVILTTCDHDTQEERASKRGVDADMFSKIKNMHLGDEIKIPRSDLVLNTSKNKTETKDKIIKAIEGFLK